MTSSKRALPIKGRYIFEECSCGLSFNSSSIAEANKHNCPQIDAWAANPSRHAYAIQTRLTPIKLIISLKNVERGETNLSPFPSQPVYP